MVRISQWRCLGIDGSATLLSGISVPQNVQALGVGRHNAVFDPVMNHLDEMAGAGRTAMEITFLGRAMTLFPALRARDIAASRSKRLQDGSEMLYGLTLASDHHAITALDPPHATARPHVDIVNTFGFQFLGSADVVNVVRVASINNDVSLLEAPGKATQSVFYHRGGHHQPSCARRIQFGN